jgi:hypothetical protein
MSASKQHGGTQSPTRTIHSHAAPKHKPPKYVSYCGRCTGENPGHPQNDPHIVCRENQRKATHFAKSGELHRWEVK